MYIHGYLKKDHVTEIILSQSNLAHLIKSLESVQVHRPQFSAFFDFLFKEVLFGDFLFGEEKISKQKIWKEQSEMEP